MNHPMSTELALSADQATAFQTAAALLAEAGIDLAAESADDPPDESPRLLAITGKAGSGKTLLLARLVEALDAAGARPVSADWENRKALDGRNFAVLAPTNKAASVLRQRGVPATTIHRIIYTPVYDPEYEKIAEWLEGERDRPKVEGMDEAALDKAEAFFEAHKSIPGALAAAGVRGSDFITGWTRRTDPLDIALIDEASMLDDKQMADLREIFPTLILFGDPAQLAPVGQSGAMVFDSIPETQTRHLARIHRQEADNPILDLAHALADPEMDFDRFERMVEETARRDDRVVIAPRADAARMARAPILVWRNATRIRLISAFRAAFDAPPTELMPGEPLICDGVELPLKHRRKRLDLEARGLIKGAQCVFLGPGTRRGFSKLHIFGAENPHVNVATIVKIERPDEEEPFIPFAAQMGAAFLHGAAVTIHKAQGSQWQEVQLFAPDLFAASRAGRVEAGIPLWKRLAYVAITRAEERLFWVTRYRLARPEGSLDVSDLAKQAPAPLKLEAEQ